MAAEGAFQASLARWLRGAALVATLCWLVAWATTAGAAVQVVDDRGIVVHLDAAPQRIVSLLPSLTETVCVLQGCARLVGVDDHSNFPARVHRLPRVGSGLAPDIEAIVALRPDLVLMSLSTQAAARLESLGVKVAALRTDSYADVRRAFERVGQVLGVEATAQVWQGMEGEVRAVAQALPPAVRGLRVYFEVNSGPYAASETSFIGDLLARLGARNVVPGRLGPFPRLNPEFVVRADPDLIMVTGPQVDELARRPGWSTLRAVREGRVCRFAGEQADMLVRAGPRLGEAARLMASCLRDQGAPR